MPTSAAGSYEHSLPQASDDVKTYISENFFHFGGKYKNAQESIVGARTAKEMFQRLMGANRVLQKQIKEYDEKFRAELRQVIDAARQREIAGRNASRKDEGGEQGKKANQGDAVEQRDTPMEDVE